MRALSRCRSTRSPGARISIPARARPAAQRIDHVKRRVSSHAPSAKLENAVEAAELSELLDPAAPALLGADEILSILPHRYPFLLVDRVTHMKPKEMIVGLKNVTMNDNFFPGHFPNRPIMPGVLQVEALAQLAGILMLKDLDESAKDNFFFGGIDNCRFKKPVVPGDALVMKVDVTKMNLRFGIIKAHGEAYVRGETVCNADLTLVVAK